MLFHVMLEKAEDGWTVAECPAGPAKVSDAVDSGRTFGFAGDTVVDPFMGIAATNLAAAIAGRNSIGIEVDSEYSETEDC